MLLVKDVTTFISVFNKCALLVLTTANWEFTDLAFDGKYSDFNKEWY